MSEKFYSMLFGGTLTMMVICVLLMADSIVAGVVIGTDAVEGVTLVTPLYSLAAFFACVFSVGVPIVYSTAMGAFDKEAADRAFGFGLLMAIASGILLFLGVTLFGDYYLRSCNPLEPVLEQARGYLYWMRFTILILPLSMLMVDMVYNDGDETISTIANVVEVVGNLIASIVLSHYMGIRGIGLASFLFNVVALLILFAHLLKKSNSLRLNIFFSVDLLKHAIRYSIIDASSYLFIAILTSVLNFFVIAQFGAKYLIMVSVVMLTRELQMVFDGIGEAITPILGVYAGEKCMAGIRFIYRLARKTAIIEGILVSLLLIICAPLAAEVLDITDSELFANAVTGIRVMGLGSVFVSILFLLTSYYLVIDRIALGFGISALRDVILSLVMAAWLGKFIGLTAMFIGLAAAPALSYLILMLYITLRYGRENCPIFLTELSDGACSEIYNLEVEPEEIIDLQKKVEGLLTENGLDRLTIGRVKLLIEELYMLIREKNGDKRVLSECTVTLRPEGVQIITKDSGVIFDISEDDVTVTSIVSFAVAAYMEKLGENRRYLTTMSFNRSSFMVQKQTA